MTKIPSAMTTNPEQNPDQQPDLAHLPISRWGVGEVAVGRRVIVRRFLSAEEQEESARLTGSPKKTTDTIGRVVSLDPFTVRPQNSPDTTVTFDPARLQIVKALPDQTVRNGDIRAVEIAACRAFPGKEFRECDGWLLRAGDGITERSNSAIPISPSAATSPVPLQQIIDFYQSHQLPVQICVPDRICKPALALIGSDRRTETEAHADSFNPTWRHGKEIIIMTRPLDLTDSAVAITPTTPTTVGLRFDISEQPDDNWLALYHFRGEKLPPEALNYLRTRIEGQMGFGRLLNAAGETVAITRGTITESDDGRTWLGFSAVEVAAQYRRQGLGTLLASHMLDWGAAHGAQAAYLHVIEHNAAGIALYRRLNFQEHHRHRYAVLANPVSELE